MDVVSRQMVVHGQAAYESQKWDEAIEIFSTVLHHNPVDWKCRLLLALSYIQAEEYTPARHELTFLVDRSPDREVREHALQLLKRVLYAEQSPESEFENVNAFYIQAAAEHDTNQI